MTTLYPVFVKLAGQPCLVVGGGRVAGRKVRSLLEAGARVRVISPALADDLRELAAAGAIEYEPRGYRPGDVVGAMLVISAADDPAVNRAVAEDCRARRILLNAVDDPEHCSFYVPAALRRGDLTIAVSTGGKSPLLARKIRERLEAEFDPRYGDYLALIGEIRHNIIRNVTDPAEKEQLLEALVTPEILNALANGDYDRVKELVDRVDHRGGP
ncbi:MAG: bifunctional precorrin-2 dehydrogenase/sirohydrochlorin ferrochelatase [Candidatus Desulforudis sp.]|nr:bifunctional precorrin-2 dehydrogenase/sirohydrochlorin ferrochelatase [Desulforudis sp.]